VLQVWFQNIEIVFYGVAWPDLVGRGCHTCESRSSSPYSNIYMDILNPSVCTGSKISSYK
jgi:hypothetical protein